MALSCGEILVGLEQGSPAAIRADPVALLQDEALRLDLRDALAALDARQRGVVQAIYLEGRSYEDAAERLGLPLGTLKRLQTGALRQIGCCGSLASPSPSPLAVVSRI